MIETKNRLRFWSDRQGVSKIDKSMTSKLVGEGRHRYNPEFCHHYTEKEDFEREKVKAHNLGIQIMDDQGRPQMYREIGKRGPNNMPFYAPILGYCLQYQKTNDLI